MELERRLARIEELEQQLVRVRQTASESEVLLSRLRVELHELSERPAPRPAVEVSEYNTKPSVNRRSLTESPLTSELVCARQVHEMTAVQAKLTHALEQLQAERSQTAHLTESTSVLRSELELAKNSVLKLTQEVRVLVSCCVLRTHRYTHRKIN